MIQLALLILALSPVAFAEGEISPVEEVEFGIQELPGELAALVPEIKNCYFQLAVGRSSHPHKHQILIDKPGEGREKYWRIAVVGSEQGKRGIFIVGRGKQSYFAPFPSADAREIELDFPDFKTAYRYAKLSDGKLEAFTDKRSATPPLKIQAKPVKHLGAMGALLLEHIRSMVPTAHQRFKATGERARPYLDALQACRLIGDPRLRRSVDEEIQKFSEPR